jgi:hypothetical protein
MTYKCDCCGFKQNFTDGEAAFQAGWDAPPHFFGYVSCGLCPAVCAPSLGFGPTHVKAHAYWQEHGRPAEFNQFCVPDEHWGESRNKFEEHVAEGEAIAKSILGKQDA